MIVRVRVACSGGADSLALAAALAWLDGHEPDQLRASSAMVVDHGLQDGSAAVAAGVVEALRGLGLDAAVARAAVDVDSPDGLEAAARASRYEALTGGDVDVVLLGHTMDDQAETVLLGLARGSGTRSLSGMPERWVVPPVTLVRPLLGLRRDVMRRACADWGLTPWDDPMNDDPRFARVRARRLLPVMEEALGPGLVEALARTAALARADADHLDAEAELILRHPAGWALPHPAVIPRDAGSRPSPVIPRHAGSRELGGDFRGVASEPTSSCLRQDDGDPIPVATIADAPEALRGRIVRMWLGTHGVTELTYERTQAVLALVTDWRGQGPVDLPGGVRVTRQGGAIRATGQNR